MFNAIETAGMWQLPAVTLELAPGEVHLWRARCVPATVDLARFSAQLTLAEMARAGRLVTETLRRRFVQAHSLLHTLLGAYTQMASQRCELAYEVNGKPYLLAPQLHPALEFNMSHAGEVALIALARGNAVGVDVEQIRPLDDLDALIKVCCSDHEQQYLAGLVGEARLRAFYQLWTRKEAWLKLRGVGLGVALTSVDVLDVAAGVTLVDVPLAEMAGEYVGALALPESYGPPMLTVWDALWQSG